MSNGVSQLWLSEQQIRAEEGVRGILARMKYSRSQIKEGEQRLKKEMAELRKAQRHSRNVQKLVRDLDETRTRTTARQVLRRFFSLRERLG